MNNPPPPYFTQKNTKEGDNTMIQTNLKLQLSTVGYIENRKVDAILRDYDGKIRSTFVYDTLDGEDYNTNKTFREFIQNNSNKIMENSFKKIFRINDVEIEVLERKYLMRK